MKVTSVSFRSSVQIGSFQHAHVEMTATLGQGDTPAKALASLRDLVAKELARVKAGDVEVVRARKRVKFNDRIVDGMREVGARDAEEWGSEGY
jgi:hypothetical protein